MSRILKRPMFRRGGPANEGIMSGIVDRTKHANDPFVTGKINREQLGADAATIQSILNEFAPVPKTRLPIGEYGINLALGMDPVEALRDPYAKFTKADDIRRAQLAKRGQGAVSTALQMQLKKQPGKTRTLTPAQVKKQYPSLPEGSIVQIKPDGEAKITKPDSASVKKRADLKSTIGLLNRVEEKYLELGKPVSGFFSVDPDRLSGQIGQFFGTKKGTGYATLKSDIDKTTTFLTQAISGAQVSEQEAERIRKLIPQLNDTEVQFEAKLKSLRAYLGEAVKNYGGDVEALMKAGVSASAFLPTREKELEDMSDDELEAYRQSLLNESG